MGGPLSLLNADEQADAIALRSQILTALEAERGLLQLFVSDDQRQILREPRETIAASKGKSATRPAGHGAVTTSAFTLYVLLGTMRDRREPTEVFRFLTEPSFPLSRIVAWLEHRLTADYRVSKGELTSGKKTHTGKLPNAYNTGIHVAGLLVAWRALESEHRRARHFDGKTGEVLQAAAVYFAEWLKASQVEAARESQLPQPESTHNNPYHRYWVYVASLELIRLLDLAVLLKTNKGRRKHLQSLRDELNNRCESIRDTTTLRTAFLLAAHEAGIEGHTDATDFLFTMAVAGLRDPSEHHSGSYQLISRGVNAFFMRHVSPEGSFYPRPTAFVDRQKTAITLSTAEHGALLLEALSPYCQGDVGDKLIGITRYILNRRLGPYRWGSDQGTQQLPARTIFASASALAYLQRVAALLQRDIEASVLASTELTCESPPRHVAEIRLDDWLEDILSTEITEPIASGMRDQAALSLVLHGPPGTSKTTCAQRIASDLGWPVVLLSPSAFLHKGLDFVEAEADRIFKALWILEDKVVLFDEFEEMLKDRKTAETASRFLTTSMLPWLHAIRDRGRIVFIIATNELDQIDVAARRFGRINRIIGLDYPSANVRQSMFDSLLSKREFGIATQSIELLRLIGFPSELHLTRRPKKISKAQWSAAKAELDGLLKARVSLAEFGHGHIKEVLRRLAAYEVAHKKVGLQVVATTIREVAEHDRDPENATA